jgi:hypothetical protein
MNEELNKLEQKIRAEMKLNAGRLEVYRTFQRYEILFSELKNPTPQQQNTYLDLYAEYMHYVNRGGKWN